MANIMSQIKLNNHTSRDGFDLSRKNAFTAKVGELLPVCCIECIPGDKINGRVQHFTRTMPVNTAAFTRVREYYDWFFVPTNLLWNKFNTFVTQMTDNNQHATSISSSQVLTNQHPYFTTNQLATCLYSTKRAYEQSPNTLTGKNIFGFSRYETRAKLLHYLGYGDFMTFKDESASVFPFDKYFRTNANLNPFPLLAYQKIYQDFFRNSQWENAYAPAFNIDYISGAANSLNIPLSQVDAVNIDTMLDLRYCNWNKDLFMGVLPNSQYGDAASIIMSSSDDLFIPFTGNNGTSGVGSIGDTLQARSTTTANGNAVNLFQVGGSATNQFQQYFSPNSMAKLKSALGVDSLTILALRQAEALQKWREITQSQQQDYKNQIEAHFGVSPSDALSERCKYIDGSVSNLDISEVNNTNLADSNAAVIAGKGVGVGDGRINFSTDVHGYLMCIYHAVPLLDYAHDGIKRQNLKTMVTDYAIPEFDRTGMVQVPVVELTNSSDNAEFTVELLGYAPRYYDYKQAIDEVHGAFIDGGLGSWVAPVDKTYIQKYLNSRSADGASLTYQWFKVNPSVLNPIFAQDADSTNATDQLLVNSSFEISAVRNLDRNGLPF